MQGDGDEWVVVARSRLHECRGWRDGVRVVVVERLVFFNVSKRLLQHAVRVPALQPRPMYPQAAFKRAILGRVRRVCVPRPFRRLLLSEPAIAQAGANPPAEEEDDDADGDEPS